MRGLIGMYCFDLIGDHVQFCFNIDDNLILFEQKLLFKKDKFIMFRAIV